MTCAGIWAGSARFCCGAREAAAGARRNGCCRLSTGRENCSTGGSADPRWDFDARVNDPDAPLFPSERRNVDGSCAPVTDDALRAGLTEAVARHLPAQVGRLTPHVLRHFAASDLYRDGMDVVAIQELLGHSWINTTMIYVNSRVLHQAGEKPQVTRSRRRRNSASNLRPTAA